MISKQGIINILSIKLEGHIDICKLIYNIYRDKIIDEVREFHNLLWEDRPMYGGLYKKIYDLSY